MSRATCAICGAIHDLLEMQVAFRYPDPFLAIPESERERRCWGQESTDFLQIDGARSFIRGTLPIPIIGHPHEFAYGIWAEIKASDMLYYFEHFADDLRARGPIDGAAANEIRGYQAVLGLKLSVRFGDERTRPRFTVENEGHPLAADQRAGIPEHRVYEVLQAYGVRS